MCGIERDDVLLMYLQEVPLVSPELFSDRIFLSIFTN